MNTEEEHKNEDTHSNNLTDDPSEKDHIIE
jgi:hypothetical protein